MEHRNGAHKHPIDAWKLPNATQKLPDDTCMRLTGYMGSCLQRGICCFTLVPEVIADFRGLPRTSADFRFGLASPADPPIRETSKAFKTIVFIAY